MMPEYRPRLNQRFRDFVFMRAYKLGIAQRFNDFLFICASKLLNMRIRVSGIDTGNPELDALRMAFHDSQYRNQELRGENSRLSIAYTILRCKMIDVVRDL